MIVQPNRECVYAWYPEVVDETLYNTPTDSRDIYLHNGLDKDLLKQKPLTNGLTNTSTELFQRYQQSIAPSDLAYHSTETINEALSPPWALHYERKHRPATSNPLSNMSTREEPTRRLKSAPIVRSPPQTAVLTIPEPRFVTTVIPVPPPQLFRPKTRASSAKARLNTTVPNENHQAHASRRKGPQTKLSEEEIQQIFKQIYGENFEQPPQVQPVQIIYTQPQSSPPPVYLYEKSGTWSSEELRSSKSVEVTAIPLNPHYLHRPGVIAVRNVEKTSVVRGNSASRKTTHRHRSVGKCNEPLLAVTPIPQKSRLSLEIDGMKLVHNPKLTLNDKSPNLTKYFIDGRLYLIKEQFYNVFDNIDPSSLEKYNQTLSLRQRRKYYQTIPIEKFQIPQSTSDVHSNASEAYSCNASPKRLQRYVVDPSFISTNLNTNRMSLSQRPSTATVYA